MIEWDLDNFDIVDNTAERQADLQKIINSGNQKRVNVMRFIQNNPNWSLKSVIRKFGLTDFDAEFYPNGIAKILVYADCSMRVVVLEFPFVGTKDKYYTLNEILDELPNDA